MGRRNQGQDASAIFAACRASANWSPVICLTFSLELRECMPVRSGNDIVSTKSGLCMNSSASSAPCASNKTDSRFKEATSSMSTGRRRFEAERDKGLGSCSGLGRDAGTTGDGHDSDRFMFARGSAPAEEGATAIFSGALLGGGGGCGIGVDGDGGYALLSRFRVGEMSISCPGDRDGGAASAGKMPDNGETPSLLFLQVAPIQQERESHLLITARRFSSRIRSFLPVK